MNKVYKVVWSKVKNCYVVASELAKRRTKSSKNGVFSRTLIAGVLTCVLSCGIISDVFAGSGNSVLPITSYGQYVAGDDNVLLYTRATGTPGTFYGKVTGNGNFVMTDSSQVIENLSGGWNVALTNKQAFMKNGVHYTTMLGAGTYVGANESVALGYASNASETGVVSVGHKRGELNPATHGTATSDYFRRIVNVANGTDAHDAATVAQTSTTVAGSGISVATATNTDGSKKYTISGSAATSSALGMVKVGSNITNSSGTISLTKANVVAALGYTPPTADTNTTYTAGTGLSLSGTTFSVNANGSIASGNANPLKGGTVYSEVRPTANGTFVKTANTTAANLTALDNASKNAIKALSVNGKTITYTKGDGTTGTITTQDTNTTYSAFTGATASAAGGAGLVKAPSAGDQQKFLRGDGTWATDNNTTYANMSASELSTGTATTARSISAKTVSDYVKTKTDDKINNLSISENIITYTKGNGTTGTITVPEGKTYRGSDNVVIDNDEISVKNLLQYDADANDVATLAGNSGTKLTNLKSATLSRTSTDAVTGAQLYATNQNIAGFATDINRNKTNIQNLNTSVTAALESVSASSQLVDVINNTKADKSLNNLDAAGMQVINNAAVNAVQEYMATQEGTRKLENTRTTEPMLIRSAPLMRSVNPAPADTNYVVYDDDTANKITLEGDNGTVITNVSNGEISETSTDAINGSQLYGATKIITDVLDLKADKDAVYTKSETDTFLGKKADLSYVDEELTAVRTQKADKSYVDEELSKKADTMYVDAELSKKADTTYVDDQLSLKADVTYVDAEFKSVRDELSLKADTSYVDNQLSLKADKDAVYTKTEAKELFADKKETTESLNRKADADASNIDVDAWTERLGTGEIAEGNEGLVKGGTVYDALNHVVKNNVVVADYETGTIRTAEKYDVFDVVDISKSDGSLRVMTGVATNPSDPTSVANVGYVDAVGQNIVRNVNEGLHKVDTKISKVGANAAAMASLAVPPMDGDEKWAFSAAVGHYDGKTAGAIGAFYMPQDNVMVNLRGAVGNGEDMIGAGVGIALNRGNTPHVSKAQLVRTIQEMKVEHKAEISSLKAQVEAMAMEIKRLQNSK